MNIKTKTTFDPVNLTLRITVSALGMTYSDETLDLEPMADAIEARLVARLEREGVL